MITLKSFLKHLETLHDIKHRSIVIKHIGLEPDLHDPDYYCRACEYSYSNLTGYRSHLKTTHYMILRPLPKLNNRPRPNNPNFHCRSCDTVFSDKIKHRQHFVTGAQMVNMKKKKNLGALPDWDDPDYYCRVCDYTYTEALYHQHCEIIHQMKSPEEEMSKLCVPDLDDLDFYCKVCDITYKSRRSFRDHCRNVHLITVKIFENFNAKPNTTITTTTTTTAAITTAATTTAAPTTAATTPTTHSSDTEKIPSDPIEDNNNVTIPVEEIINTFCRVCDEDLSSEINLRLHMLSIHSIYEPSQVMNKLKPNVDDPNYYCCACNWKAPTRGKYNSHLRSVHNIIPNNTRGISNYNHDFLPDPCDPNFYCRVCKITKRKKNEYRSHCRKVHHMKLEPLAFPYPDAVIDINSPDYYCAKCDMHYKGKQSFRYHLKSVHKLKLITNRGIAYPDAIIDMLNPNFYCAQCDKHYSKKWNFKLHLINVHNLINTLVAENSSSNDDNTLTEQ